MADTSDKRMAARVAATAARVVQVNNRCYPNDKAADDELQADAAFLARHLSPMAWERLIRCLDKARKEGEVEYRFREETRRG